MKPFTNFHSLRFKIFVIVAVSILLGFTIFSIITLHHQNKIYIEDLIVSSQSVSETVISSLEQDMMVNDTERIRNTVRSISRQEVIRNLRIYSHQGMVWASSDPEEEGTVLFSRPDSRECTECHLDRKPADPEQTFVCYNVDSVDKCLMNVIVPIPNKPGCATADCHVHSADATMLGFLNLSVCRKRVQKSLRDSQIMIVGVSLLLAILVPGLIMLMTTRIVVRPLDNLVEGTVRVARGELDVSLPADSKDELGKLASSFNTMVEQVKHFQNELKEVNEGLEKRVEQKAEKLKVAQRQIIQTEKMSSLGRLAAVIAHEINNPISGLVVFINLIQKQLAREEISDGDKKKILERLELMEAEAKRCGSIVSELLSFSHEEKKLVKCRVSEIVKRTVHIMELRTRDRDVEIKVDISGELPEIKCDPGRIQQILMNLLQNAIEAMPDGGEVRITGTRCPQETCIVLKVEDNGIGIPASHLPHVFEPFYSSKDQGQSIGIGLFVVYGVIEQHGGTITVESKEGEGTTFVMTLPI